MRVREEERRRDGEKERMRGREKERWREKERERGRKININRQTDRPAARQPEGQTCVLAGFQTLKLKHTLD